MLDNIVPRWRVRYLADGLALTPPEGPRLGGVRIAERKPLRRARDVIDWALEQMAGFGDLTVSPVTRLTTLEGEYAALCTIATEHGPPHYQRTIGMIWGDHFYTQIDGGTDDAASYERFQKAVGDLTYYHSLGLGVSRRRRYLYTPPPGWRPYPRGLIAEWYAPGFPAKPGFVSVFPARPTNHSPAAELDRLLHEMSWFGFDREATDERVAVTTNEGMSGFVWRTVGRFGKGPRLDIEVCVLRDEQFSYVLRLENRAGEQRDHHELFAKVYESVQRLPSPMAPQSDVAFNHWIT